jgi:hypothetical protein
MRTGQAYISAMRTLIILALFALLAASFWFVVAAWERLGGGGIPFYGYVAIAGGVVVSLAVGGGLMALVFYSNRHGYDDLSGGDGK